LQEGIVRYTPAQRRVPVFRIGVDLGVGCRVYAAITCWLLGYPAQALARIHEALVLAQELAHPYSLAWAWVGAAIISQFRRDGPAVHEQAEAAVALSTEQGFPLWVAYGTSLRGWALAVQGQGEVGRTQVHQGIVASQATGAALFAPFYCTILADVCDHLGHPEDGLQALAEAHTLVQQQEEGVWEAEIHRLRGVLLLHAAGRKAHAPLRGRSAAAHRRRSGGEWGVQSAEVTAEECFQRALGVARRQEAKSLELRAARSLSRLWQQQGKRQEAYDLLAPIYGWFTEGFDTTDIQEARVLLEQLA
jgi:predicted ATPase